MTHSCQARILTTQFLIPGTTDVCFNTTECRKPAAHKITIDEGDAFMPICKECFARFKTKSSKTVNTWYGWFDCDYPPTAIVKGSRWYHDKVKEGKVNLLSPPKDDNSVAELAETLNGLSVNSCSADVETLVKRMSTLQIAVPDPKQELQDQIQAIETWMRGEGKLKFKEQPKKLRELMALRAKLKLLK